MFIALDEATIHRLVFETFGLRRFTQDSPIQPDVWVWLLKLAARGKLGRRISLILTPKETPSKDGRPPGGAGRLAEKIRASILGGRRDQEREESAAEKSGVIAILPESKLHDFRIASTARNVVLEANFDEILRCLLPMTAWWVYQVDDKLRDPRKLIASLRRLAVQKATIRKALVEFNDTEFFRFAALTAITRMIDTAPEADAPKIGAMLARLAPPRPADDVDAFLGDRPSEATLTDVEELWRHYKEIAEQTFCANLDSPSAPMNVVNAATDDAEVLIWSIQRNRKAQREAVAVAARTTPQSLIRSSRDTVKADAASMLFSITTSDLTWAVVDTGIDARHPAFTTTGPDAADGAPSRVIATLDFTRLRDLLAEEFDIDDLLKTVPLDPGSASDGPEVRKKKLLKTIDSIRRRNVNGRELDWSLLAPLIRRIPCGGDTPVPADPHGTHVAGILAAGALPKGVPGDTEPFIGVCPDIKLYDLRVFGANSQGEEAGGDEFTILAALDYISWANRDPERPTIHGVNLSLSLQHEVDAHACGRTPVCDACNRLVGNGTVVVAAAGNAGFAQANKSSLGSGYRGTSITDPGNAELVITVGATHRSDPHVYGVSYFSSRGPTGDGRKKPDLVAPGEKIRSTVPEGKMLIKDGTSMAAPHVSGVCALLMARHREFIGQPKRIKEILMVTATDLGRERSFQGAGLVDALRALQSV